MMTQTYCLALLTADYRVVRVIAGQLSMDAARTVAASTLRRYRRQWEARRSGLPLKWFIVDGMALAVLVHTAKENADA
jgi:hypothetical protein